MINDGFGWIIRRMKLEAISLQWFRLDLPSEKYQKHSCCATWENLIVCNIGACDWEFLLSIRFMNKVLQFERLSRWCLLGAPNHYLNCMSFEVRNGRNGRNEVKLYSIYQTFSTISLCKSTSGLTSKHF